MARAGIQGDRLSSRQPAVIAAIGGWLLLMAGLAILRQNKVPRLLGILDEWLQPCVSDIHVDAPMPAGVWLPGLLLLIAGMALIARTRVNTVDFPDRSFAPQAQRVDTDPPRSLPWFVLVLAGNVIWLSVVVAAARGATHWSLIPLWLVAMVVQGMCWWRADHLAIPHVEGSGRWFWIAGLIVAFAITLHCLGDVPNSIWGDEGAFWAVARDLAAGSRVNPFTLGVYGAYPLISSLYQSLWLRVFGPTLWSWRFSSVVVGTFTMVPLFFLARKLLGARVAWSAMVLMVSKPYFLAFTRMGYNNIQPLLPVTAGLWFLVEALQRHSHVWAYLSGVAFGMASLTYTAGHIGLVLAALFLLFLLTPAGGGRSLRRSIARLAPCLGIGWLFAAGPFFLGGALSDNLTGGKLAESFFGSAFYGETLFSTEQLTRLYPLWQIGQHRIFFEPRLYALLIVRGVVRTGLSMVADEVATQHYLVGPLAGPGAIFFLAGLAWMLSRFRRWQATLWILWVFTCALLLSVFNTFPTRATHLVPIIPALAVLTAMGIWLFSDLLRRALGRLWVDRVAVGLTVALALWGLRTYFVTMPQRYMPDLQNVMFWRAQQMGPGSHLVFVAGAPYPGDFRVNDIDAFELDVEQHTITVGELRTADFRDLCGFFNLQHDAATCRVFFLPGADAPAVEAELDRQLGAGVVERHIDASGRPIGLEFVPKDSNLQTKPGFWRSDLYWGGLLSLGTLMALVLSPVSVRALFAELLSHASRGAIAVKRRVVSLHARWMRRMASSLLLGCLACAILGQVYFAQDFVQGRKEFGPSFWPGMVFYAFSIVYFLLLAVTTRAPSGEGRTPVVSATSHPRLASRWNDLCRQRWRIGLVCGALFAGGVLWWDLSHRSAGASYAFPFMLWVLMMGTYLAAFAGVSTPSWIWKREGVGRILTWWRVHSADLRIALILTVVSFVLRAYAVDSVPYSVGGDEASQGLRAFEFLEGTRTNMFAISELYFNPNLAYFSMVLPLAILGRTITGLRMAAVLVGTASVLLTYLLTRRLLGKQAALVSAFCLTAQHYHLHFSRLGSSNIFDTLFAPLLAYLLIQGLHRQRPGWFAAAGLTLGVAQYFYSGAMMLPVLVATLIGCLALTQRRLLGANLANFGVLALGAALAFLPMGLYEIEHPGSFLGRVSQVSIFHWGWLLDEVQRSGESSLQVLGDAFLRSSLAFNYFTDQSFWYRPSMPLLDPASAVLFVIGLVVAMRHASKNPGYLLVAAWFWLAVILGSMLTVSPPASERLVITTPALAVLVALGLTRLVQYVKVVAAWFAPVSPLVLIVVTIVLMLINIGYYFLDYTPTRVYGNPTAEVVTRLSRELATLRNGGKVYFFGAPAILYESAAVPRFLTPEVEGVDVPEHWTGDLSFVDTQHKAWFVFLPERLDELEVLRTEYPGGAEVPVHSSADGRLLYVLYEHSGG